MVAASPQIIKKAGPPPPVISTEAKRIGEISSSDGTGSIKVGDLSTQSIMGSGSHLSPIAACGSARDDGGSGQHWTHLRCEGSEGSEGKVLKIDRPLAGGFLSLTGLWPEGCGGGFAADYKKAGPPHSRHFDRSEAEWRNLLL